METPHELAEERVTLSGEYSNQSERLGYILSVRPAVWMELRKNVGSDKAADRAWEATEMGIEEMKLRLSLKAKEKRMSAIRTMLEVLSAESRNQY
jgi:hypothetical protein